MNQVMENENGVKSGIPIWRKYTLSVQEASEYFSYWIQETQEVDR